MLTFDRFVKKLCIQKWVAYLNLEEWFLIYLFGLSAFAVFIDGHLYFICYYSNIALCITCSVMNHVPSTCSVCLCAFGRCGESKKLKKKAKKAFASIVCLMWVYTCCARSPSGASSIAGSTLGRAKAGGRVRGWVLELLIARGRRMPPKHKKEAEAAPSLLGRFGTSLKCGIVGLPNVG